MSSYAEAHDDIQALVRGVPTSHPVGLFLLVRFMDAHAGRQFLGELRTTSVATLNHEPPSVVLNVAMTYAGLMALGVAMPALQTFPDDFVQGMALRADLLGDDFDSAPKCWEAPWRSASVHAWIGCYARDEHLLDEHVETIERAAGRHSVSIVGRQPVGRLMFEPGKTRLYIGKQPDIDRTNWVHEHFGFADGVSNPPILGINPDRQYAGRGKQDVDGRWSGIAAGEFVLGYADEVGEFPVAPKPRELARHGSFMVYRKLRQDVPAFHQYMIEQAALHGMTPDYYAEKMIGRHRDGEPLIRKRGESLNNFVYADDTNGRGCPLGAHARRSNPRDQLGFGTTLVNRHRVLRRAITYGDYLPPGPATEHELDEDRGLIFISLGASISRQFEFVQKQWVNTGNELGQGNTRDPIVGNQTGSGGMVIPGRDESPTVICSDIPRFVVTAGGDYFFLPGMHALSLLASNAFGEPVKQ
jgi:Dyp-type peroxidase family